MNFNAANPYNNPHKRAREDGVGQITAPRHEAGLQSFKVVFDGDAIETQLAQPGSVLPKITAAAHRLYKHTGLFTLINDPHPIPHVRHVFNGLDATFARQYPGDPMMQMLALKAIVRPTGCANEFVESTIDNKNPSVGNKFIGEEVAWVNSAQTGRRMVWDVRRFEADVGLNSNQMSIGQAAEYDHAYGLEMVPHSEETIGTQFNKMASELVTKSATWEASLMNYPGRARPALAAVMADWRHLQTAFILGIELALKRGILVVPSAALHAATTASIAAGTGVGNGYASNVDPQLRYPAELRAPNGDSFTSFETAARIANAMGLTSPSNPITGLLSSDGFAAWANFTHTLASSAYYSADLNTGGAHPQTDGSLAGSINAAVEFGAEWGNPIRLNGRYPSNLSLKDDLIGCVVRLQLNHTRQALSAYAYAVDQEWVWLAGTAYSTATRNTAWIFMHK